MSWKKKLEEVLRAFPEVETVEISEDGKLATITSKSFEAMTEAQRQSRIWGHLRTHLPDEDLRRVEFVFTNTPQEHAEAA